MNNTQVLGHMAAAYYISIGYWTAQNCESLYLVHIYFPLEEAIHRVFYYFDVSLKKKSEAKKILWSCHILCYFLAEGKYTKLSEVIVLLFFPKSDN